jgi:large subunit ribosomal protein L24
MSARPKIRKGDRVIVLTGKDKGRKGEVLKVLVSQTRAIVQGVNMVTRHQRQTQREQGGLVRKEASIHISNLAIEDPKTGKPTRIGAKALKDGRKVRVARGSGEVIDA